MKRHLCFLQICPNRCTVYLICLYLFSKCFGHPCAHHQEKMAVSMRHWYLLLCMGGVWSAGWISIQTADQTPLIQSDKYQCRIDTVLFSWWWAHGCPKHVEKRNKYIKQNCAPSWTYLQDYTGMHAQRNKINFFACMKFRGSNATATNFVFLVTHM